MPYQNQKVNDPDEISIRSSPTELITKSEAGKLRDFRRTAHISKTAQDMHNDQLINRLICQARTIKQLAEKSTRRQDSKAVIYSTKCA